MDETPTKPRAVLFACGQNSVRSPMAAALARQAFGDAFVVASAGVRKGELDGFAIAAMNEVGIDIGSHEPMTFEELEDLEDGLDFDLIVTLAPEAHHKALELTRLAMKAGHSVRVIQTEAAQRFVGAASFAGITGAPVLTTEWERDPLRGAFPGDPMPAHEPLSHLELVHRADVLMIAPA